MPPPSITETVVASTMRRTSCWRRSRSPADASQDDLQVRERRGGVENLGNFHPAEAEARRGAEASLVTSMGRMAAHTAQVVTWEEALNHDHELSPNTDKFAAGSPA